MQRGCKTDRGSIGCFRTLYTAGLTLNVRTLHAIECLLLLLNAWFMSWGILMNSKTQSAELVLRRSNLPISYWLK